MEIHFTPDVQAKLDQIAAETGRTRDEVVQEAVAGYFDELAELRGMLDNRFEDVRDGKVKLVPGNEVVAHFREKSAARRS
jgi:predicted DNA-binding protein